MNWDTLDFRNNKLALTVWSSGYSKVSGLYGKLSDFKRTENDCTSRYFKVSGL